MASIILPVVAKSMGANAFWMGFASFAGGLIDQQLFGVNQNVHQEVGKASDLQLQSSSLGVAIVKGYGKVRIAGNVIWGTKFTEHVTTTTSSSGGGKGGGGGGRSVTTTTYSYSCSFAVLLCKGPIVGISGALADGTTLDLSTVNYTLYKGTEDQMPDPFMEGIEGEGKIPAYRGMAYIVFKDMTLTDFGNRIPNLSFIVEFPTNELRDIVSDICTDAGYDVPQEIDIENIPNQSIVGFTRSGDKTFRSQIEQLQIINTFDGIEREGKIVFRKRNFWNSAFPVSEDEFGAYESQKPEEAIKSTRKHDLELPKSLKLNYISQTNDYQTGVMTAQRKLTRSLSETSLSTDIVMDDAAAKSVAETRLYEAWMNRVSYELALMEKYAFLTPGDILVWGNSKEKQSALLTKSSYGRPGLNKISATAIYDAANQISRYVDGSIVPANTPATDVEIHFLDIPKLPTDTSENDNHFYVAATAESFYGVNIFRSTDGGSTYNFVNQVSSKATIGTAQTALPAGITHQWDLSNTVDVVLTSGTLESRPKTDVLNYYNAALLGNEIIQYTTATLIAKNIYRLSGLLRGRVGTEHQIGTHAVGEKFIVLKSTLLSMLNFAAQDWYTPLLYKIGPRNLDITDDLYKEVTVTPQAVMSIPWSPCHVKGSRDTSGNLVISWKRRTRGDGSWKDYAEVPLSETYESYQIDVMSGSTVKRTLTSSTASTTYTAAQQQADFGSNQSAVTVKVYQMSESRGRGIAKEATV